VIQGCEGQEVTGDLDVCGQQQTYRLICMALSCAYCPAFQPQPAPPCQSQLAGDTELDDLRDRMRALKRLCRHRTLLAWKRRRVAAESALSTAWRAPELAGSLEAEAIVMQVGVGCRAASVAASAPIAGGVHSQLSFMVMACMAECRLDT
jgi:hypothetical protein